jgi:hypothetical protein
MRRHEKGRPVGRPFTDAARLFNVAQSHTLKRVTTNGIGVKD